MNRNFLSKNVNQAANPFCDTYHARSMVDLILLHIYEKTLKDKQVNKIKFLVGIGLFDLSVNKVVKSWHLFFFFFPFTQIELNISWSDVKEGDNWT